tara:strand:+ start:175 stop:378 length:204 start_codon:yes stop_codon:yes gene_type:complete
MNVTSNTAEIVESINQSLKQGTFTVRINPQNPHEIIMNNGDPFGTGNDIRLQNASAGGTWQANDYTG